MTDGQWYPVPIDVCDALDGPETQSHRGAFVDLCSWAWRGEEPARDGRVRGEVRSTLGRLAREWDWSRSKVSNLLKTLVKLEAITVVSRPADTSIFMVHLAHSRDTPSTQPANTEPDRKQRVTGRQRTPSTQPANTQRTASEHYIERDRETERQETLPHPPTQFDRKARERDAVDKGGEKEQQGASLAVDPWRILGLGRTQDGNELYISFESKGPRNPAALAALRRHFRYNETERVWYGARNQANRELLAAIHPEAGADDTRYSTPAAASRSLSTSMLNS